MTEGKTRLEAARWFFETLVLQTKDFVDLQQVWHQTKGSVPTRADWQDQCGQDWATSPCCQSFKTHQCLS